MKKLSRVVWTKGMFLTPQHFQTQDQAFDNTLDLRFRATNFANWGVSALKIDQDSLENGVFRLERAGGILPDGLAFDMPELDQLPGSAEIAPHFPPSDHTLDVYLAIPEHRPHAKNTTILNPTQADGGTAVNTRYVAETHSVLDDNQGVEDKPVQVGRRNLRLLFGSQGREGFTCLRVAELTRGQTGEGYILSPQFAAPCLDIATSDYLMSLLGRQIEILATRSNNLATSRRQRSRTAADFTTTDLADYWLLHTLNSYLPLLKHIHNVRQGHPEALYTTMLQLAGGLSTFSLEADPLSFPAYRHEDPGPVFARLGSELHNMLQVAQPVNCVSVPLELKEHHIWLGTITEDHYFRNSRFFLAISAQMQVDDLIREVPRRVKMSSPFEIQRIVQRALPGIALSHEPAPPTAIRARASDQYFRLHQSGELWDGVVSGRDVSVFVPSEFAEVKMELLIVLEPGG